jgi:teichuronic acid biosynthesis glycosyltransferase TuaH
VSGRDVVFTFWNETWADAVQRKYMPPDRLAQTLLTSPRVGGLLVGNPYRSLPRYFARRLSNLSEAQLPLRAAAQLTTPLRWRRHEDVGEQALRTAYTAYDTHMKRRAEQLKLERPAVITTNPYYAAFAPLEWAGPVTYYAWDDWSALASLQTWWKDLDTAYAAMAKRGTRICAVSQPLLDRIAPTGPGAVVPNGIVSSEWQPPWATHPWFESLPRPRLLYVGALHERLNTDTVREVAESFPDASIVFVGPVINADVVKKLELLPNVSIHPPMPHSAVAGLMHSADVCLMPHHRNALTESMSPLKVYEYCATGRPIVATDLPPVRNVHKNVHLVPEGASFAETIKRALAAGPTTEDDRQAFVESNSWRHRHEEILDLALA